MSWRDRMQQARSEAATGGAIWVDSEVMELYAELVIHTDAGPVRFHPDRNAATPYYSDFSGLKLPVSFG